MRRSFTALALATTSTFAWLSLSATSSATSPTSLEDELLRNATLVFLRAVDKPATAIPVSIMLRAHGIAVIPAAAKDGALYYGVGVLSARGVNPEAWTPPAVLAFQGAIPLDLEADRLDFVVVAQTWRGLDHLTQERFASPVTQPIFPGPLGPDARARMNADLLAYMQFGDYFAGVTIDDWEISEMKSANEQLYGRPYSADDILRGAGFFRLPPAARLWRDALRAYFREMS